LPSLPPIAQSAVDAKDGPIEVADDFMLLLKTSCSSASVGGDGEREYATRDSVADEEPCSGDDR